LLLIDSCKLGEIISAAFSGILFGVVFPIILDDPAPDFDAFHLSHTAPLELNSATTDFSNFHVRTHDFDGINVVDHINISTTSFDNVCSDFIAFSAEEYDAD